jgi:ferrous iron transport protein B
MNTTGSRLETILNDVNAFRWQSGEEIQESLIETIYQDAKRIASKSVSKRGSKRSYNLDRTIDRIVTSRIFGFPIMVFLLAVVFWLTVEGANVPSGLIAAVLIDTVHPVLKTFGLWAHFPWWLNGLLFDGVYLAGAWVVSVMLPPMAIFFPLFTVLEDYGYLPRVAFNLDNIFRKVGAHGKQALTMSMGYGCNAAGVVATRIIDSPRERIIAIITNNFSLCNGRWPTQILISTIFIGSLVKSNLSGLVSAGAVVGVAVLGIIFMFLTSWGLSRTILKGEASLFSLELPPYRPPRILQTLYTSLIDRTLIVLWRAVVFAFPAGAVIWLISNIHIGTSSIAQYLIDFMDPFGLLIGLNGVILLAYIIAIPANEIVIPTVLMLTVINAGLTGIGSGAGVLFEADSLSDTASVLQAGGWTLLTGINLMLFSLLHNPCSTTIYTIYKETKSKKWTTIATVMPVIMGMVVCLIVAFLWRVFS